MLLFDILDKLENYTSVIPHMDRVIDIMDHSKPYDDDVGEYSAGGDGSVKYIVSAHLSSVSGFEGERREGKLILEIVLEGDEIVSVDGSVFRLSPGVFLVYDGGAKIKRGIASSLPVAFKTVWFVL